MILFSYFLAATCPQLEPPVNGAFWLCPQHPVLGETCGFRCDPRFRVTSRRPLVCSQSNKGHIHWSAPPPFCRREFWLTGWLGLLLTRYIDWLTCVWLTECDHETCDVTEVDSWLYHITILFCACVLIY